MGILNSFKEKIFRNLNEDDYKEKEVDNLIALGVLLWEVSQADDKFLPHEKEKIEEVLRKYDDINDHDMPIVMRSIKEASLEKIDLYAFTKEVDADLSEEERIIIVENLFRVACADNELDQKEHEMIRTISKLFRLEHAQFIDAKIKVKKEFGMDTAGL